MNTTRQIIPPCESNPSVDSYNELAIQLKPINDLKPEKRNARTHSKKQIKQIANSIKEFGFTNPILISPDNGIIAGHGRVSAAKSLGIEKVPTLILKDLSPNQIRAYIIADNKIALNAGWDNELLGLELQELSTLDLNFDISVIGFETAEIDIIIGDITEESANDLDEFEHIPPGAAITQLGDVWNIGSHRLICGDATNHQTYTNLMNSELAQMIFTDPPYNVPIDGHVSGLGSNKHREFIMATGEMSKSEFTDFLHRSFEHLAQFSVSGSIHFICMDWRHINEITSAGDSAYSELKNLCVWSKTNGGMGSLYRSQHELVFVYKHGNASHINNVELGKHGRYRTNVWKYPGMNTVSEERDSELALHPTVKPIDLVKDAILDCSKRGGIILDAFAGSGTTLLAAEVTGRRGYGIELDPLYCDLIIRRMREYGLSVIHAQTGVTFELRESIQNELKEMPNE